MFKNSTKRIAQLLKKDFSQFFTHILHFHDLYSGQKTKNLEKGNEVELLASV